MARIEARNVGSVGVVLDVPSHELPIEAWSDLRNARAKDGYIEPIFGETERLATDPAVAPPLNIFFCPTLLGLPYWVYAGQTKVGVANAAGHEDITPAATTLAATDTTRWTAAWLNGIFVLNSKSEEMLVWDNIDPNTPTLMKRMSAIASTEFQSDWRFNAVRTFKEIIIGIGFTDGAAQFPTTIVWSAPATAGTVPTGWDPANLNNIANEKPLSATPGAAIDGLQVGDNFILCKEDATVLVTFQQGSSPLGFRYIDLTSGVLTINCMTEFKRGQAVIFNQNYDLMITDGTRVDSLLSDRLRKTMQTRVNSLRSHQSFVVHNPLKREVWVCYPRSGVESVAGEIGCEEALIWNYEDNTFQFHDLGRISHIAFGTLDDEGNLDVINDIDVPINTFAELINSGGLAGNFALLGCSTGRDSFYRMDFGAEIDGASFEAVMERRGVALTKQRVDGVPQLDHHRVKVVSGIWPTFEVQGVDISVNVSAGAQEYRDGPTQWDGPYTFMPLEDQQVDFLVEGIYVAARFEITVSEYWRFHSYAMDIQVAGDYL
jgi:hypothetical protein